MITQAADFTGNYRIPQGVSTADVTAALQQGDVALLREFFDFDTAQFIAAAPTAPPATTLQTGAGGLNIRWREVAVPAIFARSTWGVAGMGASAAKVKNHEKESPGHMLLSIIMHLLEIFFSRLQFVSRTYWVGVATVAAVAPLTLTITMPTESWQWLRVGSAVSLRHPLYVGTEPVAALPSPGTVDFGIAGFPGAVGDEVNFVIELKLRKKRDINNIWV